MLIENKYLIWLFRIFIAITVLFIFAPILTTILMSFNGSRLVSFPVTEWSLKWYENYFEKEWITATLYSLQIGALTACATTILGTVTAYTLVKGRFYGKGFIYFLLMTPMIVPSIVIAIALYFFFVKLQMVGNILAVVIGHCILAFPLVLVSVTTNLQGINQNLEKAAMSLGASRLKSFLHITLPLILPGIISGALFSFLLSFDELLIPMFLGGVRITTLPKQIWGSLTYEIDPTINAVSSLILFAVLFLLFMAYVIRKRRVHRER